MAGPGIIRLMSRGESGACDTKKEKLAGVVGGGCLGKIFHCPLGLG